MLISLFVLLPSQLAFHFWPDWSLVNGVRVDFLAPTIYLTDLIILALMVTRGKLFLVPLPVIILAVVNIAVSQLPQIAIFHWLKIYEYYWLYRFLTTQAQEFNWRPWLSWAIIWTSILTWVQFGLQHSVGGIMYWLGERSFSITAPGIAKIVIFGSTWLRPYATLPHPNALAGWLLVAGLLVGGREKIVSAITVIVTFSRSAIFLLPFSWWPKRKLLTLLTVIIFAIVFWNIGNPTSLPERQVLNQLSLKAVASAPLLGVGLGNFIPTVVPFIRQPVHNIYLLLLTELGIPTGLVIIYLFFKKLRSTYMQKNLPMFIALAVIATIGLVDHYWITLQQNLLLMVIVFAATIQSNVENSH